MPYLKSQCNFKSISSEQNFDQAFNQLCTSVEPTILLVRPGGCDNAYEKKTQIIEELKKTQGF